MSLTPYAACKVVNAALEEAGVEKTLPPQMFYNYTTARINKGKASLIELDADNKITEEGLSVWLTKYLVKQGVEVKVTDENISEDQMELEFVEA